MEPDALVQCPYDRSHQVRVSRLPYHLVRCQQNNPQVSRTLATCPFNARHRVPRALLRAHVTSCPDKLPLELPPGVSPAVPRCAQVCPLTAVPCVPAVPEDTLQTAGGPPQAWQPPPCQEDWDAEQSELELEEPLPFILQVTKGDLPVPCHSADPAAPPEGLPLRKPRPATAAPRLGTAGPRSGTAGPRSGTARPRPVSAGAARGVPGVPPAVKYSRK
ncbi:gametocyte-specific factor 1 isoform X1 [Motacilla alba alba]|uniref:gametocyte-specific factor 1 isoform X1 n=1 Tax=Motacilla alba alba TaxID=1094192 RepID=UPI0018D57D56|nr:gametocyte-specific factor 1 isoform X1 [Motacilla alba alba]